MKTLVLAFFTLLLFTSCSKIDEKNLIISTNAWIGYSPLFYAREMGWLEDANIELISVVSLGESMHLFEAGSSKAFTGTQYEFKHQREKKPDLIPVILLDRSDGGDAILSNKSIEEIKNCDTVIDVYLELGSINEELFNYFAKINHLPASKYRLRNRIQDEIQLMKNTDETPPTIIVTYIPYTNRLVNNGFKEIASTKNLNKLFVVDAIYAPLKISVEHREQFIKLNELIKSSLVVLKQNPKAYYEKVKVYLDNPTYQDFLDMHNNIEWIHKTSNPNIHKKLNEIELPTKDLLR